MRITSLVFAIVLFASSAFTKEHPLKMSYSKLTISVQGMVTLETRIFLDDLTAHMQHLYGLQKVDFSKVTTNSVQVLQRYLKDQFYFEQNGKKLNLWINTITPSKNGIGLVVSMSMPYLLDTSKEVFLVNTLLCDAYPMQTNDINYLNKHYLLNLNNPKIKIQLD